MVCQHSHCIGCKEEYLQGTIVYGQGNFLFDDEENEYWQTSLLIRITVILRLIIFLLKRIKTQCDLLR